MDKYRNNVEIKILREYLRIASVHPDIDYGACVEFLERQAESLGLPCNIHYPANEKKPVVVITWVGLKPDLPAIMFNSHMDVVPVVAENWTRPPFGAEINKDGFIYARGIQDTKALGMQYLAAIRCLKKIGFQGKRTAHITFMPDEEIGSLDGMKAFVKTKAFQEMNIGFAMDEGYASRSKKCPVVYGERTKCQVCFRIRGLAEKSSDLSADVKFASLLTKLMEFRKQQQYQLKTSAKGQPSRVSSLNLTQVNSSVSGSELSPCMIEATFDIRLAVNIDPQSFCAKLMKWCRESGGGIDVEVTDPDFKRGTTPLDETNIFWQSLKEALKSADVSYRPVIMSGNTDMRFLRDRSVNIPAVGFSPMPETPMLAHGHDEYLHANTYLRGIEIFVQIMQNVLNAPEKLSTETNKKRPKPKFKCVVWK